MANMVYVIVCIYIVASNVVVIKHKDNYKPEVKNAVHVGSIIWVIAAIIQGSTRGILISGLAVVLMVLHIYLSFENPREYIDTDTKCMNKRAFKLMLDEKISTNKPFYAINIVMKNVNELNNKYGYEITSRVIDKTRERINYIFATEVYRYRGSSLGFIVQGTNEETMQQKMNELVHILKRNIEIGSYKCLLKIQVDMVPFPEAEEKTDDGFEMYYQPIYSPVDKSYSSAEALIRLKDKDTIGFVSPEEFIPIAEAKGCIYDIGEVVFKQVCSFAKEYNLTDRGVKYIEVNLSGLQMSDEELPKNLKKIMDDYKVKPDFINLEVTETASVESSENMMMNIEKLKDMGCSFSMDDYGTGYSNLSKMAEQKYDLIKLDKSLIWPCFDSKGDIEKALVILTNTISMVSKLGVGIVAEGVETEEQARFLIEQGVDHLQGYLYSRPVDKISYIEFINKQKNI